MAANNKCSDCGNEREKQYKNDSCCRKCRSFRNKKAREEKRIKAGKQPYGSGRSPLCSTCKKPKEEGRQNESRCKECKSNAYKKNRAIRRQEKGLPPFGYGRKLECSNCDKIKEKKSEGYCYACRNEKSRDRRKFLVEKESLHAKENQEYKSKIKDPSYRFKKYVRTFTYRAIRDGVLIRKPCEVCGAKKVDAHHDDYERPLSVRWLCRRHHNQHHRDMEKSKILGDK